jgi:thiol-disulfide isomerase/thioredoxin
MISSVTTHRFRTVFIALLAVVALLGAACSSDSEPEAAAPPDLSDVPAATVIPAEGDHAADFTVLTLDGAGFTLSDHLENDGRPVFLNLWASWCPPCRAEMPDINAASQNHTDIKFIGISVNDDPSDSVGFVTSAGITYTIGFDVNGDVAYAYDIAGLPASFIISSDGVILQRVFGAVSEADIDAMLDHWFSS